jgi:hypothetical protein
VGRYLKLAILLLVVAAVATILLTPSPSDDVPGVMHRNHGTVGLAVALGLVQLIAASRSSQVPLHPPIHPVLSSNFLELVCQHLC